MICTSTLFSQSKQDYIWFFGKDQNFAQEGIQGIRFDFNEKPFKPEGAGQGLSFDRNNASICDKDGNLLFYTNGCAVANREHQVMPNGDSINAGNFFDLVWQGDCRNGYPGRQDITILPDPNYDLGYYIIHKPEEFVPANNPSIFVKYLKYSYIDMSLDGGLGDVTEKNVEFASEGYLWSFMTAIGHINQKDWWIVQPKDIDNIFYSYLLSADGFELIDSTVLGDVDFNDNTSAAGDAKFSPDGTKYAFLTLFHGLWVYDFDRSTGQFSNFKSLSLGESESQKFASVEFSPNSRFVYLSATDSLYQVDLWEDDLEDGKILIDTYDGVQDPFGTTFFMSALAPDCKIYIRPGSGSNIMHVIHKPDEKGLACNFVERGLRLPQPSATGSYPNFPRFRVDEVDKCDPTITSIFGDNVNYRRDMTVYPNPARDVVTVEIPEGKKGQIVVFDMMGQIVSEDKCPDDKCRGQVQLDLSGLSVGSYSVEFLPDNNKERLIYTQQVLIIK
jgi:hypothetical protein